jgi:hypothetical protein
MAMNAAYRAFLGRSGVIGLSIREVFPEVEGQQLFEMLDRVYKSDPDAVTDTT